MTERLTDEQLRDIAAGVMISDRVVDLSDAMAIELLALRARAAKLEAALSFLFEETKWKSTDKDNMEFEGRVTCYQLDQARAALKDAPE